MFQSLREVGNAILFCLLIEQALVSPGPPRSTRAAVGAGIRPEASGQEALPGTWSRRGLLTGWVRNMPRGRASRVWPGCGGASVVLCVGRGPS